MKTLQHTALVILFGLGACSDSPPPTLDDGGVDPGDPDARPSGGTPDAAGGNAELDEACTPGFDLALTDTDPARRQLFLDATSGDPTAFVQGIGRKVCSYLYKQADEVRDATHLELRIEHAVGEVAWKAGDGADITVMISTDHLNNVHNQGGDVAREVQGVLFHEMTHMYQHDDADRGGVDGGLIEGIADFVRISAGFTPAGAQPDPNGRWNSGYTTTAFFLVYVNQKYPDFVYKLNKTMDEDDGLDWSVDSFEDITGKDVDALWQEYADSL